MYLTSPGRPTDIGLQLGKADKGRGGNVFLFLLFLHFNSCSSFFPVPLFHLIFYLFSPFLWETKQNDLQGLTCLKPQYNQLSPFFRGEQIPPGRASIFCFRINQNELSVCERSENIKYTEMKYGDSFYGYQLAFILYTCIKLLFNHVSISRMYDKHISIRLMEKIKRAAEGNKFFPF